MEISKILNHPLFNAFSNAGSDIFIYVADFKTDYSHWSPRAVEYFGLESEYISNTGEYWMNFIHPDDREVYIKDIGAILDGLSTSHNCQYRARNKYGEYVWVECRGSVTTDENGENPIFAGIIHRLDNYNKYDPLTHKLTAYEIESIDIKDKKGSLMFIEIENVNNVNINFGQQYVNQMIIKLVEELEKNIDKTDVIYRYWGTELVIYSEGKDKDYLVEVFEKTNEACKNIKCDIKPFSILAGIVSFPEEGDNIMEVIGKAERCLGYIKSNKGTGYIMSGPEIDKKLDRRDLIAKVLTECIKQDYKGFELFFQPIVSNDNSSVKACEALLRWNPGDEKIGFCGPGEFIPILESNNSIISVGYFVMREAVRHAAKWGKIYKKFNVSFNVSYLQLLDNGFIPAIIEAIEKYGADPSNIVVELTESVFAEDSVLVRNSFKQLKDIGIRIALDDFGTGHSSFMTLHNLDIDIIKLDQAFIRGTGDDNNDTDYAIVESIAFLCDRIKYSTVAEGVETEELWKKIGKFGFTGLQGYLFSKPLPEREFEAFLDNYEMRR